ncbi:MAG: hypothetical protein QOI74_2318 [Micromonosporaceae bacterium]|nr:hypothetical protein [Micromonosporaceae bacterium]
MAWVNSSLGWSVWPFINCNPRCAYAVASSHPNSVLSWAWVMSVMLWTLAAIDAAGPP